MPGSLKKAPSFLGMARMSKRGSDTPKTPVEQSVERLNMPKKHKAVFVDAQAMKDKLRENMHKPKYDVTDFYKTEGLFQQVARDSRFENITLGIISFNALWIAIDCDANDADVLHEAHPIFIIAENFFCLFFTFELTMRFGAFQNKVNCLKDAWFVFDSFMVIMMIMETWVMTLILLIVGGSSGGGLGNAGLLRLLRLMRLSRMARMARLLRAMPELLILIKGMVAALRSVFFTLLLLILLLYVYAIMFRQLTADSTVGKEKFPSIMTSMNTLVLDGIIFDGAGDLMALMVEENEYILIFFYYLFVLLAALTVMNMLIGVLCEVVSAVAETEHEEITMCYLRDRLQQIVNEACQFLAGEEVQINKEAFLKILAHPTSAGLLSEVQVNVFGLVDLVDTIFASESGKEEVLDFGDLVETMLDQRETNLATVKDITELRKYVRGRVDRLEAMMEAHMVSLGGMMEKGHGLPPGTWQAELKKCRQDMDLAFEAHQQPSVKPQPNKPAVAGKPDKEETLAPPQFQEATCESSPTVDNGSAVTLGRPVDPPTDPIENPASPGPSDVPETFTGDTINEGSPTEEIDATASMVKDATEGGTTKEKSKRRLQKKQKSTAGGERDRSKSKQIDEFTPLALNADSAD